MRQFAVIGLGRFGTSVAETLTHMGHQVLAVDKDGDKVQALSGTVTHAVQADVTDEAALKALGIRNVDVAVVAIGQDMESSILATLVLKALGVKYVIAKAHSELHGRVLEKVGADRVIYPERDMGIRVANNLISSNILDYIELSPDYGIVETVAPKAFVGRSLRELNLRAKYGVTVVAIKSKDSRITVSPGADDRIHEGDVIVALGSTANLNSLKEED